MVATVVAGLAAAGRLDLDDAVARHVPVLRHSAWAQHATLRDLLANRSGLPLRAATEFGFDDRVDTDADTLAELMTDLAAALPADQPHGGRRLVLQQPRLVRARQGGRDGDRRRMAGRHGDCPGRAWARGDRLPRRRHRPTAGVWTRCPAARAGAAPTCPLAGIRACGHDNPLDGRGPAAVGGPPPRGAISQTAAPRPRFRVHLRVAGRLVSGLGTVRLEAGCGLGLGRAAARRAVLPAASSRPGQRWSF